MKSEFLLASEAGRLLGVSTQTVRALEERGELKAARTPTGTRIFTGAEVRRLAAERSEKRQARQSE